MRKIQYQTEELVRVFHREIILTMTSIKNILGSSSKMTVFRKLKPLNYQSSYSHAGKYYTLNEIAEYDRNGLWFYKDIRFSLYGHLNNTLKILINTSNAGFFAHELEKIVKVKVHNTLGHLFSLEAVRREQIGNEYLYISKELGDEQYENRKSQISEDVTEGYISNEIPEKIQDHMRTFLSILNEKQRRLYVGLESLKLGHGGDIKMSIISGMNVKTISRGRYELESKNITLERIRNIGAGRPGLKKKKL